MIHITQNKRKLYEVVIVAKNGNLLLSSHQGYERKSGVIGLIRNLMKDSGAEIKYVQDDTLPIPVIICIYADKKRGIDKTELKTSKKYIPKSKK